jgi:hypothetical protein
VSYRPYSYAARFVSGLMTPGATAIVELLDIMDHGPKGHDLLLRQKCPFPDTQEGRLNRAALHRLVDAWLDGVEFYG